MLTKVQKCTTHILYHINVYLFSVVGWVSSYIKIIWIL